MANTSNPVRCGLRAPRSSRGDCCHGRWHCSLYLPIAARAAGPAGKANPFAPFSDFFVREVAFDEPVIELAPPHEASSSRNTAAQPGEVATEPSLAERVEALERYIREMEETKQAPAEEPLPEAKAGDEAQAGVHAASRSSPSRRSRRPVASISTA